MPIDYCINTQYSYSFNFRKRREVMNGRRSGVPQQPGPGAFVHG